MKHPLIMRCAMAMLLVAASQSARAAFNLTFVISDPNDFTAQRSVLDAALLQAEALWESVITGYRPGISLSGITIRVEAGGGLAAGGPVPNTSVTQGGFRLTTMGILSINPEAIVEYAAWDGDPGPDNPPPEYLGLNYVDEILAHEIGHVLGIGTQWLSNGVYMTNSFRYRGFYGIAAYKREFDPLATFVPVEDAGNPGTPNTHWNQRMRSSPQEGNPLDPWSLDPRVGIVGPNGRDFASELMTGALDPDYGEPYLSMTTIQSLRDIGFTVVPEPAAVTLFALAAGLFAGVRKRRAR